MERLLRGRFGPESMTPLTEATPGLALAEAYDIQQNLEQAVVARGERVIGWKVGLTGSISKILRPKAGESVRASFTRLGSVACRFS